MDCEYCGKGFQGPTGEELCYEYVAAATPIVVTGVEVVTDEARHDKVRYRSGTASGRSSFDAEQCFASHDEAVAAAASLVEQAAVEQERTMERKDKASKSYGWHAGYHLRSAKDARQQVEHHERKATLMKAKAKAPEVSP